MKICATNKSASLTGIYAGLLGLAVGPSVDTGSSLWLVVAAIAFAIPAYFYYGYLSLSFLGALLYAAPG